MGEGGLSVCAEAVVSLRIKNSINGSVGAGARGGSGAVFLPRPWFICPAC